MNNGILKAAKYYAEKGFGVLYLPPMQKKPQGINWQRHSMTQPNIIDSVWSMWEQEGNCGLLLGPETKGNIKVIDIECDSPEASEQYDKINFPKTPTYKGKRGRHHLFRWSDKLPAGSNFHYKEIEVRTGNGKAAQSVLPPSIHPDGIVYEWIEGLSLDDVEIADIPDDIIKLFNEDYKPIEKTYESGNKHLDKCDLAVSKRLAQFENYINSVPGTQAGKNANKTFMSLVKKAVIDFAIPPEEAGDRLEVWGQKSDQLDQNGNHYPWERFQIDKAIDWTVHNRSMETYGKALTMSSADAWDALKEAMTRKPEPINVDKAIDWKEKLDNDIKETPYKLKQPKRRAVVLSNATIKPLKWLISKHTAEHSLNLIYGPWGSCKSFYEIDKCCCLLAGIPFMGFKTQMSSIMYICGEGERGIKKRVAAWEQYYGVEIMNKFWVIPMPFRFIDTEVDEVRECYETIKMENVKPDLIVIDTIARNFGGDENSTKDMTAFVDNMTRLQNMMNTSIDGVHHTGKDLTKGARGSVALSGACDGIFYIEDQAGLIRVENIKHKDSALIPTYMLEKKVITIDNWEVDEDDPDSNKSLVLKKAEGILIVRKSLTDTEDLNFINLFNKFRGNEFSMKEAAETLNKTRDNIKDYIAKLVRIELLGERKPDKKGGSSAYFFLNIQSILANTPSPGGGEQRGNG